VIARLWRWILRRIEARIAASRERRIIEACGCVAYCPRCHDPLQDQAIGNARASDETWLLTCRECGCVSRWMLDAPVPLLVKVLS
jgi:RNase P subunit RPR2